jgi:putative DNA primase/helicase
MAAAVLAAADGHWPRLLIELAGLAPEQLQDRHQPCPACGGTDRYRWDRDDGPGGWYCNQCGGRDRRGGGGDGMDLLQRVTGWDFATAARRIADHLALPCRNGHQPGPAAPPPAAEEGSGRTAVARRSRRSGRPARIPEKPPPDAPPPELGRAVAQWCYRNEAGEPLYWIQRIEIHRTDPPGTQRRKLIVHRTWLDGGWHFPSRRDPFRSEWPAPRPLYRLPELIRRPWSPVLIAEGEKAAEAAARLFPDHVAVGWSNGTAALQAVDWSPLTERAVTLWPDADEPGRQAMARLSVLLLELGCSVHVVLPPISTEEDWDLADAPGAVGWDLADANWTTGEALAYLQQHRRQVLPPPSPAAPEVQQIPQALEAGDGASGELQDGNAELIAREESDAIAEPASGRHGRPFTCLGYDADGFYYQPCNTGQVVRLGRGSHTATHLLSLAPIAYWETLYPGRRGPSWVAAASDLFDTQARVGMFDPDRLRGRGAWWDRGRCVLHLGDRLVIDGRSQPITAPLDSTFHYQRAAALEGPRGLPPLSDEEALAVLAIADRFRWEVPASAFLLAGWITLAPICGALRWRPHLWLTAAAGSGKSAILERFVSVLLGDMRLVVVGNSTEAGIRQWLRCDALPVVLDEAESNERADQQRIQAILALARVASSESHAATVKGTPAGEVSRFKVRSMFLLSSIATGLKQGADRRRFAQLTLRNPTEMPLAERQRHWQALDRDLDRLITADFAARLLARTVSLIPVIQKSVRVFSRVAAEHFDSQALGDQYGTLLAGAWALQASTVPSEEQAQALIDGTDWSSYRQSTELPDELRCLNRILQHQLRVEVGDRAVVTRTVLELVELAATAVPSPMDPVQPADAADVLGPHGLRIREGELLISNTAEGLARLLEGTPWAVSWGTILSRLPGASRTAPVHFRGLGSSRAVAMPLNSLNLQEASAAGSQAGHR